MGHAGKGWSTAYSPIATVTITANVRLPITDCGISDHDMLSDTACPIAACPIERCVHLGHLRQSDSNIPGTWYRTLTLTQNLKPRSPGKLLENFSARRHNEKIVWAINHFVKLGPSREHYQHHKLVWIINQCIYRSLGHVVKHYKVSLRRRYFGLSGDAR